MCGLADSFNITTHSTHTFRQACTLAVTFCYVVCQRELLLSVTRPCGEMLAYNMGQRSLPVLLAWQGDNAQHSRADLCRLLSSQGSLLSLHEALLSYGDELLIRHCLAGHLALRRPLSLRSTALVEAASAEGLNVSW